MRSWMTIAAVLAGIFLLGSCAKDNAAPETGTPVRQPLYLLDKITYKNTATTASYVYNTDSTVKQVVYATGESGSEINYSYHQKLPVAITIPGSLYNTSYTYTNGYLTSVISSQYGKGVVGYKLVYTYAANGLLDEMKHYKTDEAGDHLQYTHLYQYNIDGLPAKITSVGANVTFVATIHSYSDECDFEPSTFISSSLNELYAIYNYPLLSRLSRLPKNITVTKTETNEATITERIYDATFTITNKKLEKIEPTVTYPAHPQYNVSDEWTFNYQ